MVDKSAQYTHRRGFFAGPITPRSVKSEKEADASPSVNDIRLLCVGNVAQMAHPDGFHGITQ